MNYNSCLEKIKKDIDSIDNGLTLIDRDILLANIRTLYQAISEVPLITEKIEEQQIETLRENLPTEEETKAKEEIKAEEEEHFVMTPVIDMNILNSIYGSNKAADKPIVAERAISENITSQATISFNDVVGESHTPDIASVLSSMAVEDIKSAIGINDRFLIINELFAGETSLYENSIDKLNSFSNIDDAYIYLQENFGDKADSYAFKLLVDLLERKFS